MSTFRNLRFNYFPLSFRFWVVKFRQTYKMLLQDAYQAMNGKRFQNCQIIGLMTPEDLTIQQL